MNELSNRTLALLLVFAIVFSLGGTLLALGKMGKLRITGMVTNVTEGNVNATVTSRVALNLTVASVDFGTGYVGMGCNNCTIDTQGGSNGAGCCVGFSTSQVGLVIENTGNTYIQVDANFTKNASQFIGGDLTRANFSILIVDNETQSCLTLGSTWSGGYAPVPTYNSGESAGLICDVLSPDQANDTIRVHVNITIPDNAPAGSKNTSVIITGTGL
ncbi:hypothetical protein COV19_07050 [Candidatus Woesearchaeota archaeon CG10_big_fil_rev_8_21_14_0_10_44_13]|nr:MAG: hypothetical protein COV19_07050 [Candidatus Woesearchaeota archaeon CG10_big_fil_rev_8_21_14_0_10_44_13]